MNLKRKPLMAGGFFVLVLVMIFTGYVLWRQHDMGLLTAGKAQQVITLANQSSPAPPNGTSLAQLPPPVQKYFRFAAPDGLRPLRAVRMKMVGDFRRPGQTSWAPMTVEQYVSVAQPAYVFIGVTRIIPGLHATAMDAYVNGKMHMEARVLSAFTVVKEMDRPELNATSIMRFFIEAPLYPNALLPSQHLSWEPIDQDTARAVVKDRGKAVGAYRVTFDGEGRIERYDAEVDGNADQPFHGAGEHAKRSHYQLMNGYMIPTKFVIARVIDGRIEPFWRGRVVSLEYDRFELYP